MVLIKSRVGCVLEVSRECSPGRVLEIDAKKLDENVKRLKGLVDGLEHMSKLPGAIIPLPTAIHSIPPASLEECPPPYSLEPTATRGALEITLHQPSDSSLDNILCVLQDADLPGQYLALKSSLNLPLLRIEHPRPQARDKLATLWNRQFKELRIDVYDEFIRRQQQALYGALSMPLSSNRLYHQKRCQAREKLSTLPPHSFELLASDVVFELERRFPLLMRQV